MIEITTKEELLELVIDILAHFSHRECPKCQAYIGLDNYISQADVKEWLSEFLKGRH